MGNLKAHQRLLNTKAAFSKAISLGSQKMSQTRCRSHLLLFILSSSQDLLR